MPDRHRRRREMEETQRALQFSKGFPRPTDRPDGAPNPRANRSLRGGGERRRPPGPSSGRGGCSFVSQTISEGTALSLRVAMLPLSFPFLTHSAASPDCAPHSLIEKTSGLAAAGKDGNEGVLQEGIEEMGMLLKHRFPSACSTPADRMCKSQAWRAPCVCQQRERRCRFFPSCQSSAPYRQHNLLRH